MCQRFIPAGAGNSLNACSTLSCGAVYPRWRGELSFAFCFAHAIAGLSPLARGTL
ncbi:hypothetical protein CE20_001225 [Escherichia coli]|nr:hypothetical protein [Escherichia coli]